MLSEHRYASDVILLAELESEDSGTRFRPKRLDLETNPVVASAVHAAFRQAKRVFAIFVLLSGVITRCAVFGSWKKFVCDAKESCC